MYCETAITVKKLSKCYQIFNRPEDRLKLMLTTRFNKFFNINAKKYFQEFWALKDVSFEIKKGETVGIIGLNGSGKSTLLQLICGTLTPTNGSVSTNGRVAALLELGSGFNPEFTGRENIYANASILGFSKNEIDLKLNDIISFAGIGEFIEQPIKTYSSGMFARLAFAVAINVDPEILIIDEALSVGDILFQQKCMLRMEKMMNNGTTILFVSHSISQVRNLCSRAIYLKEGKIIDFGASNDVCDSYINDMTDTDKKFKKNYSDISDISMKFLDNSLSEQDLFFVEKNFAKKISKRSGGQELEFVSICCYINNKLVTEAQMGDRVKIVASFKVNKCIDAGTAIGIHVTDNLGNTIIALNSNFYDIYLPQLTEGDEHFISYEFDVNVMNIDLIFGVGAKPDPKGNYFYDRVFGGTYLKVYAPQSLLKKGVGGIIFPDNLVIEVH